MKRLWFVPAVCVLLTLFTGCALLSRTPDDMLEQTVKDAVHAGAGEMTEEAEAPAPVRTAAPKQYAAAGAEIPGARGSAYTLERQTAAEENGFVFTAEGMQKDGNGDHLLSVSWRNGTGKSVLLRLEDVTVNGYAYDPFFAASADAWGSGSGEVFFAGPEMDKLGLTLIDEISFTLTVCPEDALYTEYTARVPVTLRLTDAEGTVFTPGVTHTDKEELFLQDGGLVFLLLGNNGAYTESADYCCVLDAFLENGTDETLTFCLTGVTVNGENIDPYWAEKLPAGTRALSRIYFTRDDLTSAGITGVDAVEFTLTVYDAEDVTVKELSGTYRF